MTVDEIPSLPTQWSVVSCGLWSVEKGLPGYTVRITFRSIMRLPGYNCTRH